jgi:hypothetical protein
VRGDESAIRAFVIDLEADRIVGRDRLWRADRQLHLRMVDASVMPQVVSSNSEPGPS